MLGELRDGKCLTRQKEPRIRRWVDPDFRAKGQREDMGKNEYSFNSREEAAVW